MNDLYCSLASAGQILHVPLDSQFVCPQCGKPLVVPAAEKRRLSRPVMIGLAGLVAGAGALFAAGAMIGGRSDTIATTAKPVPAAPTDNAGAKPPATTTLAAAATAATGTAAAPPPPLQKPAPVVEPLPATPAGLPAALKADAPRQTALSTPVPQNPQPLRPASAPPAITAPTTPARYTDQVPMRLAMMQTPATIRNQEAAQTDGQERAREAAEQARRTEAAALLAERQKKQLALAQEQKRKQFLAQQQEADAKARADAAARAARLASDEQKARDTAAADALAREQAARAEAARKLAQVAPPAGITRGFSSRAVAGGSPGYPSAYEGETRVGHVTVSCLITESGAPNGCRVVSSQGGIGFSNAALKWLKSGQVRFSPILRNGRPQTEQHVFSMTFEP